MHTELLVEREEVPLIGTTVDRETHGIFVKASLIKELLDNRQLKPTWLSTSYNTEDGVTTQYLKFNTINNYDYLSGEYFITSDIPVLNKFPIVTVDEKILFIYPSMKISDQSWVTIETYIKTIIPRRDFVNTIMHCAKNSDVRRRLGLECSPTLETVKRTRIKLHNVDWDRHALWVLHDQLMAIYDERLPF